MTTPESAVPFTVAAKKKRTWPKTKYKYTPAIKKKSVTKPITKANIYKGHSFNPVAKSKNPPIKKLNESYELTLKNLHVPISCKEEMRGLMLASSYKLIKSDAAMPGMLICSMKTVHSVARLLYFQSPKAIQAEWEIVYKTIQMTPSTVFKALDLETSWFKRQEGMIQFVPRGDEGSKASDVADMIANVISNRKPKI